MEAIYLQRYEPHGEGGIYWNDDRDIIYFPELNRAFYQNRPRNILRNAINLAYPVETIIPEFIVAQ